jgi:hypothetical protein
MNGSGKFAPRSSKRHRTTNLRPEERVRNFRKVGERESGGVARDEERLHLFSLCSLLTKKKKKFRSLVGCDE